jgi:hypothetical protein
VATVDRFFEQIRPNKIYTDSEVEWIRAQHDQVRRDMHEAEMRRVMAGLSPEPVFMEPVEPPVNKVLLLL